jgi:hypothetical protein
MFVKYSEVNPTAVINIKNTNNKSISQCNDTEAGSIPTIVTNIRKYKNGKAHQ